MGVGHGENEWVVVEGGVSGGENTHSGLGHCVCKGVDDAGEMFSGASVQEVE